MNERVRLFLIHSHRKVVGHYRQLLERNGLSKAEEEAIRSRLALAEKEHEDLLRALPDPLPNRGWGRERPAEHSIAH